MSKLVPSYRRHKNGHAFIRCSRINGGRNLYLGRWGTPESRDKYQQVLKRLSLAEQAPLARPVLTPTRDKDRSIIGVTSACAIAQNPAPSFSGAASRGP